MAAVLQLEHPFSSVGSARPRHPAGAYRQPRPRRTRRPGRAVLRRRRLCAAFIGLGLVLTVARAGAALEGSTLASPERLPHVRTVVVQPGDTLWSVAHELAPKSDPRGVVDQLVRARGTTALTPGDTITWTES
jgi:hypothetical protein